MNKPIDLSSHPILQQAFDVIQAIEKCGASVELTNAVTKAGELMGAINELLAMKGDQVLVGWEVCSPEWCNKHKACHEAPRIWFESEDGTGPHYHPSEYTAPQKPVVLPSSEDCLSCDRHYVDGMKAGWNFHEEGDNQGFIDSIDRVQKDMREARKEQVKDDA